MAGKKAGDVSQSRVKGTAAKKLAKKKGVESRKSRSNSGKLQRKPRTIHQIPIRVRFSKRPGDVISHAVKAAQARNDRITVLKISKALGNIWSSTKLEGTLFQQRLAALGKLKILVDHDLVAPVIAQLCRLGKDVIELSTDIPDLALKLNSALSPEDSIEEIGRIVGQLDHAVEAVNVPTTLFEAILSTPSLHPGLLTIRGEHRSGMFRGNGILFDLECDGANSAR